MSVGHMAKSCGCAAAQMGRFRDLERCPCSSVLSMASPPARAIPKAFVMRSLQDGARKICSRTTCWLVNRHVGPATAASKPSFPVQELSMYNFGNSPRVGPDQHPARAPHPSLRPTKPQPRPQERCRVLIRGASASRSSHNHLLSP